MRHDDTDYHIDAFLEKLGTMSREELEHKLPLAQNSLDAIEVELDKLLALRDAHVIRVAAITTRLATTGPMGKRQALRASVLSGGPQISA